MAGKIIRGAVFASGGGTNAENILRHAENMPGLEILLILTDQPYAGVIERAKKFNVSCEVVPRKQGMDKRAHEDAILETLRRHKIDWVFLAGYMRILSPEFLRNFHDEKLGVNRVVNIHPSLLPAFPGADAYLQAFNAGVKIAGVTLHFVDEGVDTGPIILQRAFEREENEEFDAFRARGMQLEYEIYAEFLRHLTAGEVAVAAIPGSDRKIVCLGKEGEEKWAQRQG